MIEPETVSNPVVVVHWLCWLMIHSFSVSGPPKRPGFLMYFFKVDDSLVDTSMWLCHEVRRCQINGDRFPRLLKIWFSGYSASYIRPSGPVYRWFLHRTGCQEFELLTGTADTYSLCLGRARKIHENLCFIGFIGTSVLLLCYFITWNGNHSFSHIHGQFWLYWMDVLLKSNIFQLGRSLFSRDASIYILISTLSIMNSC